MEKGMRILGMSIWEKWLEMKKRIERIIEQGRRVPLKLKNTNGHARKIITTYTKHKCGFMLLTYGDFM